MIRKIPSGKWRVFSELGKNMGTYDSEGEAKTRLKEIEPFNHKKAWWKAAEEDVAFTYSSMLRFINKNHPESARPFMKLFKSKFDAIDGDKSEDLIQACLLETVQELGLPS